MAERKFGGLKGNPYKTVEAPEQRAEEKKQEYYRFNLKLPLEQKEYLQEMAWRSRESITAYLTALVAADMERHPDWRDTVDELNK